MSDRFYFLDEPPLTFGLAQETEDPRDGLALFGPSDSLGTLPDHVAIGTRGGLELWEKWVNALNAPAFCEDVNRHRPWPPYPGYDVAFGATWPSPVRAYTLDAEDLHLAATKADRHERAYSVTNLYMEPVEQLMPKLDAKPAVAICIVPDEVYQNCRPNSYVTEPSDERKSTEQKKILKSVLDDRRLGQERLFGESDEFGEVPQDLEQYGLSPDFRRQLKARMMPCDVPIHIVRESTLDITEQVRRGLKGTNPLSDRLWNLGTALYYKCGRKPWKTPWAREGVCYVGLAYRRTEERGQTACCAAQMFLDSGDGIVFVGEFGPWYSEAKNEFHLTREAAEKLLRGTIETYQQQDGRPLGEVFLHARSGINPEEYEGFVNACPPGVKVVGIRVRKDRNGPRLFRYDDHPEVARRGKHPVLRGTFWQRTQRHGLLFTTGFKPRIGTYDGWEVPVPLSITVQHGDADLVQVARDILGLTKLNYNACQLGESQPITVKYSDRIGEILLANPELKEWRHNFKYYI
ncbi:MAG: hypothetical protein N0E48_18165 [Candidatus Thiodiazotropha endolucinida]|nr:hypothetical protein [Candidatus Thiodiazotropha taylori]MCW4345261.1 hypothetical protein [Candidatus Thiodiazotropha endolucinida]